MKPFFLHTQEAEEPLSSFEKDAHSSTPSPIEDRPRAARPLIGRVAVYDSPAAAPKVSDITSSSATDFIEQIASTVYNSAHGMGGSLPYTVIREIVENLIHADFQEPVVSVMDIGNTVRFSDQGPGIPDKEKALLPGFTTASSDMKDVIRGVGSGLPLVREFLALDGGTLSIEDNLGGGCVITLKANNPIGPTLHATPPPATVDTPPSQEAVPFPRLSTRQKQVLSLVLEFGEVGPTLVSKELSVGLSTAHRDLAFLEQSGLIDSDESGKRVVTEAGASYFDGLFG